MLNDIIEGYFVTTSDNLIFEVKGIVHPSDRIIAYLRYLPDVNGEKRGFRKIYDLREREEYLKKHFPQYLWYSKAHGRILQSVPRDMIKSFHNPVNHLNYMRKETTNETCLSTKSVELANILTRITGISRNDIGVTGSQLVGTATEESDIDLVIYGTKACRKFYTRLKIEFNRIPGIERYSGELLDNHVFFRWGQLLRYQSLLKEIEREKILQGMYGSFHFFIRLVKLPSDIEERYESVVTKMRGLCEFDCIIRDASNSIFTPCEYLVETPDHPRIKKLISYRGRFTEQLKSDTFAHVQGRLEDVTYFDTKVTYQQVVLGENPTDFLLPM